MRRWLWITVVALICSGTALAQDEPKPEQLKKMYDDALVQLKGAQDRRNELASENEKLSARIGELQKKLEEAQKQLEQARTEAEERAEKSFFLRAHHAAWQDFLRQYPAVMARWKAFMEYGSVSGSEEADGLIDRDWPFSAAR